MQKAVIDIGNSFTKIYVFENNNILTSTRFENIQEKEIIVFLSKNKARFLITSSVKKIPIAIEALKNNLILNSTTSLPFQKNYQTPETLGNDRVALAAAAVLLYPNKNVLVIDAGTCITYDFVDKNKEYQGGAISPGLQMRFKSLNTFTAKLPLISTNENKEIKLIGKSTEESILSGVVNGIAHEIDGVINEYIKDYKDLTVILTGGDTLYLKNQLKNEIFANLNLQATGLNHILNYNINAIEK
jgi:type III pantothenate kinase